MELPPDCPHDRDVRPVDLRTNDDSGLVCTASSRPELAWKLHSTRTGVRQAAFEIQRSPDRAFNVIAATTGRVESDLPFGADWPGRPLASREVAWCRVRLWTENGLTGWSEPLRIEGTLHASGDWIARPISPRSNIERKGALPPPLLRKDFSAREGLVSARLHVTALGLHQTWINGSPISPDLFEPGWTDYPERLLFASCDVTTLIQPGANALASLIGDGWWRGNLTWIPQRRVYGATTALLAQLELSYADASREIVATDATWKAGRGAVRTADFYNGCSIKQGLEPIGWKLPGFDDSRWEPVDCLSLPAGLQQRVMPPVRVVETFAVQPRPRPGALRVDCGQNLTGWLRLTVEASRPGTVAVRHAEVLEPDGRLHLSSLRTAEALDRYAIEPGRHVLEPVFTFHGFRFADIVCDDGVEILSCEARAVSSALPRIGRFRCSDERVNRLYENVIWSQRGNFLSIPTDCPQRDERLGWTGDIQVFAPTACANFDSRAFLSSWLVDLASEQRADGNVPSTVPNVIEGHPYEYGGVGWGDAATLVPWALYEAYGDSAVLARTYPGMKAWVDHGLSRLDSDGLWTGDFHLGDWLDPAAPPGHPELATTDRDFIASAYLAHSARTLARAAGILGRVTDAARYAQTGDAVAQAAWRHWRGRIVLTQTGCAMAIAFAIAPDAERQRLGERLAELIAHNDGRIGTGFLGTPLVLPALTLAGQDEAAIRLLLNEKAPGWLYQVGMGATTIWERWDAIRPDGSIHPGDLVADDSPGMMSFNHYAYGSLGAWLYRDLAGLAPAAPGYARIAFAPHPAAGIDSAEAGIDTPFGPASIAWRISEDRLTVTCRTPPGASGEFHPPKGWLAPAAARLRFGSGRQTFALARIPRTGNAA